MRIRLTLATLLGVAGSTAAMCGAAMPAAASHVPRAPLGPSGAPKGAAWTEEYVRSSDGTVLHVDVLRPTDVPLRERTPVILVMGAYHAHSGPPVVDPTRHGPAHLSVILATRPWERGYSVAYVDMRGFGASEGCVDFGGELDRRDALRMLRWAASRDWSTGRVVMAGRSYSGLPVLAALERPPAALAGVVLVAPTSSWYRARWMNGVHYEGIAHTISPAYNNGYAGAPGTVHDEPRYHEGWARGLRPDCWAAHHAEQLDPDPTAAYWRERELVPNGPGREVPLLAAQGLRDQAVRPDSFDLWWSRMRGWRAAWVGQFDHDSPLAPSVVGRDGFLGQLERFLDATLTGSPLPEADRGVLVQEAPSGRWRREAAWPPEDSSGAELALLAGGYHDVPGNRGEGWDPAEPSTGTPHLPGSLSPVTGDGTWTFSPPLATELHIAGAPVLDVRTRGPHRANLIALLYDVAPDGKALLVSRGAATLPAAGRRRFELYGQDWRVPAGHRIGLLLSGADELWWTPHLRSLGQVEVTGGEIVLPELEIRRDDFVAGGRGSRIGRHRPIAIDPALFARRTGSFARTAQGTASDTSPGPFQR